VSVLPAGVGATPTADPAQAEAKRAQLAKLAYEFEAMFLSEMLRGMRDSMLPDAQEQGLGNATMTDTFDTELGLTLSRAGGVGLASMMLEALMRQEKAGAGDVTLPPAGLPSYVAPVTAPLPTAELLPTGTDSTSVPDVTLAAVTQPGAPLALKTSLASLQPGPVTSPFGWRSDPFSGRAQFHAGTDIRMAYGQEVQAVASGRVQSVSERQGYGLTVVIDHGSGLETRYAHLSGTSVREGDIVDAGQVVARSGNSGRSTGPHLHLEARQDGKAIDVTNLLKHSTLLADSYADRSHVRSGHED